MTSNGEDEIAVAELVLFGSPGLTAHPGGPQLIGPGKSLALLAYLAVRRQVRRDEAISLLWGDMPEDQARNAFRQALHRIRKSVGPDVLESDREHLTIGGRDAVRIDRDRFLAACDAERWTEAVASYGGDFLEGFELDEPAFDRWVNAERMQLRGRFQTALRLSGEAALRGGNAAAAVQLAARLAASAPYEAEAALFHANVLVAAGKTTDALAVLRQFVVRLQTELELPAPPPVQQLITRLERSSEQHANGLPRLVPSDRKVFALVGRTAEMARLLSGAASTRAERGSTIIVLGDPGIGRTRLLDELRSRVRDLGGVMVLRGRERATTSVVPYAAIAEALRPLTRAPGVAGASRHLLAEAARLLPELRDSFDLPDVAALEDAAGRLRFFEGVAATIDAAAYEQPLLILLDDLHHASVPSLELLAYLTGRLRSSPVMFVLSARTDRSLVVERLRAMAQASDDDASDAVIELGPLTADETRALIEQVVPDATTRGLDVERVIRQSKGRPVLAIDLARRASAGEAPSETPSRLRDVLWARLQAAPPSQRRVFFAASLLERVASIRLLAAAAHLPEAAALDAVQALAAAGLLRDEGTGYVVAHDSTASFVADASGIAGRALLAGWAADALAAEAPNADAELANLYATAGRAPLAFSHARAAAFSAAAVGATAEATHHLTVALSFAADEHARAQIESLLTAFGAGTLRLPSPNVASNTPEPESDVTDDVVVEAAEPVASDGPVGRATPSGDPVVEVPRRASIHQWYMSIALSAIIVLLGLLARREITQARARAQPADSVVVSRRDPSTGETTLYTVATSGTTGVPVPRIANGRTAVSWIAALRTPWTDPLVSPDSAHVAVSRVTSRGKDLFVVSADLRDTTLVATGGDNLALGWSPDSRALLVSRSRTLADGSYDSDLFAVRAAKGAPLVALDTSSNRSIAEAAWSPNGTRIAWVARVGATRQRDIFVARADGGDARNVTSSPAEDFGPTWSPDGSLLAFTSTRSGAPRIFVFDLDDEKLWNVSDRDGETSPQFSPDGRSIAFEATRDGDAAVYIRPALGGVARRVTPRGAQYDMIGWAGPSATWIDRLRIVGPSNLVVGDSVKLTTLSVAANGAPVSGVTPLWTIDDPQRATVESSAAASGNALSVVARREGTARVIATIPGWRTDTVTMTVASASQRLTDDFADGISPVRWTRLGDPLPRVGRSPGSGGSALFPNGDQEWDSGVLSRSSFLLVPGTSLGMTVFAPFTGRASAANLSVGFVAVGSVHDERAPQAQPMIGFVWDGQSGGIRYIAGRESFTDLAAVRTNPSVHGIQVRMLANGTVAFVVDGAVRWTSSLNPMSEVGRGRMQLWIGGHATGSAVAVTSVVVDAVAGR